MSWEVRAYRHRPARNYDGKGSSARSLTEVYDSQVRANERARDLALPDTPWSTVSVSEIAETEKEEKDG